MFEMIFVSPFQKMVHAALWDLTEQGRKEWIGVPVIPGVTLEGRKKATRKLAAIGAIDVSVAPGHRGFRYIVKAPPERLIVRGTSQEDVVCDDRPIRDTGRFMAAVRRLNLPPFSRASA